MWDLTDKPRTVHSIGSPSLTSCGKRWYAGGEEHAIGYVVGSRDLVKSRAALTTCPECLKVLKKKGIR